MAILRSQTCAFKRLVWRGSGDDKNLEAKCLWLGVAAHTLSFGLAFRTITPHRALPIFNFNTQEVRRFETCYEWFGIPSVTPIDVVSGCLSLPSRFTSLSALFRVKATLHNPAAKPASLSFHTSSIEFSEVFRKTFSALAALTDYVWVKLDLRHTACQGVGAASPLGTEALFGCSIHRSTGDIEA